LRDASFAEKSLELFHASSGKHAADDFDAVIERGVIQD